jgi:hypothetical protein
VKQLVVTVAPDGTVKIDAIGFKGNACEKATAAIEKALGTPKGPSAKKPEFKQINLNNQGA